MVRAGGSGDFLPIKGPEAVMPENKEDRPDWLSERERRLDEQLWRTLPPSQREELSLLMRGQSSGGVVLDLDELEHDHDLQLWHSLTSAQRTDVELLRRGESTEGLILDLDQLGESLGIP
jgi:hypothetical protein